MDWLVSNNEALEGLRNLGLFLAAAIGLPLAIWRSWVAQKQTQISADNHLAETYTRAIDQLGNEKSEIQLGGLYALEKIAKTNRQYYPQIIEVLCAFVRLHAPLSEVDAEKEDSDQLLKETVQTALTILGRRNFSFDCRIPFQLFVNKIIYFLQDRLEFSRFKRIIPEPYKSMVNIDLSRLDLSFANLREANLAGAKFNGTKMFKANLSKANFENANFMDGKLRKANLRGSDLARANLIRTKLISANLSNAQLPKAKLRMAVLNNANLLEANLWRANLNEAFPVDANFEKANLSKADVSRADFQGANLSKADVSRADFQGANLQDANLDSAVLYETNFRDAFLIGARVSQKQISFAKINKKTKLPTYFDLSKLYFEKDDDHESVND